MCKVIPPGSITFVIVVERELVSGIRMPLLDGARMYYFYTKRKLKAQGLLSLSECGNFESFLKKVT